MPGPARSGARTGALEDVGEEGLPALLEQPLVRLLRERVLVLEERERVLSGGQARGRPHALELDDVVRGLLPAVVPHLEELAAHLHHLRLPPGEGLVRLRLHAHLHSRALRQAHGAIASTRARQQAPRRRGRGGGGAANACTRGGGGRRARTSCTAKGAAARPGSFRMCSHESHSSRESSNDSTSDSKRTRHWPSLMSTSFAR